MQGAPWGGGGGVNVPLDRDSYPSWRQPFPALASGPDRCRRHTSTPRHNTTTRCAMPRALSCSNTMGCAWASGCCGCSSTWASCGWAGTA